MLWVVRIVGCTLGWHWFRVLLWVPDHVVFIDLRILLFVEGWYNIMLYGYGLSETLGIRLTVVNGRLGWIWVEVCWGVMLMSAWRDSGFGLCVGLGVFSTWL